MCYVKKLIDKMSEQGEDEEYISACGPMSRFSTS